MSRFSSRFSMGPFIVMGIISFQQGPEGGPQFPIIEWSTFWYKHVLGFAPPSRVAPLPIGEALTRSLTLAFATMVVATVLGTLTAQAFRQPVQGVGLRLLPGRSGHDGAGRSAGPWHVAGGQPTGHSAHLVGHGLCAARGLYLPFAFLVMLAIFNRFDRRVEEAAWALGVSPDADLPQGDIPDHLSRRAVGDAVCLHARPMTNFRARCLPAGRM